jgi:hypothetical protein
MRGKSVKNKDTLTSYGNSATYEFECRDWTWRVGGVQRAQETSRYFKRLDLLKVFFDVFIDRVVGLCFVFCRAL